MADSMYIDSTDPVAVAARKAAAEKDQVLESLAHSVMGKFTTRASKRGPKENQWLRAASLYYGKLAMDGYYRTSETPFAPGVYTARPDVNVVRSKCSIAIAQTVSVQFGTSNKNWDISPNKDDHDPASLAACAGMSDAIEAQLEVCKYSLNCRRAMWDRVVLGTGILKGPNSAGKLVRSYQKTEGTEVWLPSVSVDHSPVITRINPWFFYPDETTEDSAKLADSIETHPLTALELKKLMKHQGFKADAIAKVLESKPEEFIAKSWADFAKLSENNPNLYKNKYMVLEYNGPITKTQLDTLEIEPTYESTNDEYYGEVWVCQGEVIRLELENIEASFSIPYYISVWEKDPGSVFGYGVPLLMEDAQRVVNETWHMILDNTSISSGPQVAMQKHLIEPANGKWELAPRQIWYLTDAMAKVDDAIQFFDVPNVADKIVPIMQMAQGFSEDESGIPLITAGLSSPDAAETATGSMMMHQASTTLLDFMSEEWDDNITAPVIEGMYAWNMQNNADGTIKGSYTVDVRTSTQYKNKQLHIRDLEKLSVESAQNPALAKYLNMDVVSKMRLEMMNLPSSAAIKTDEQVAADQAKLAAQGPTMEMLEMQLKARKQTLAENQLAFDMKQEQQRALWEHQEKMSNDQVRLQEASSRMQVAQEQNKTELIKLQERQSETQQKLQTKSAEVQQKLTTQSQIAREKNQTTAYTKGMEEKRKQGEAQTYQEQVAVTAAQAIAKLASDHTVKAAKVMSDHHTAHAKIQADTDLGHAQIAAQTANETGAAE